MEEKTLIGTLHLVSCDIARPCKCCRELAGDFVNANVWGVKGEMCVDCFLELQMRAVQELSKMEQTKNG